MTSVFAIVRRILTQFALDKRTLALLFVAPLVVLWLLSVILGADTVGPKIATVDLPAEFQTQFGQTDARITEANADEASALLAANDVAAVLSMEGEHMLKVELEDAAAADDAFNNAVLVLKSKAASSTNTDALGTQIVVTDYAKTGTVMTKASGGAPSAGDVYEVYPVIGAAIGGVASLGDKRLGITLKTVGATKLRCIGHDYERGTIKLMAIGHALT